MTRHLAPILMLTCSMMAACASSAPKMSADERALQRTQRAVERGVRAGVEDSEGLDEYEVAARRNPPHCEGPNFEVFVRGRWTRVWLDMGESTRQRVDRLLADSGQPADLAGVYLKGYLSGERLAEDGIRYPVFYVDAASLTPDTR